LKRFLALSSLLLLLFCARDVISRAQWEKMSAEDRVLYVKSLVGAETAKDAKGGRGRTYDRPAEDYVSAIDQAYARGDARNVHEIFEELGR
jgi:hypothetical protein